MEEFHIDAELLSSLGESSEKDLQALAELHKDTTNNDQNELYIYLCFLIFRKTRDTQNLEQAIQRAESWAAATAASHPDRDRRHRILNTLVLWDHQYRATEEDIGAVLAPSESRESVTTKPDLPIRLQGEAVLLARSLKHTGRFDCLNEAIDDIELAISIAGESTTTSMLNNLGVMLGMRFKQTGSADDLNQAISVLREVANTTPHNHPDRAYYLSNLGIQIRNLFEKTGSIDDLDCLISVLHEVVDVIPRNHPDRASCLNNLGIQIMTRFEQTASMDNLNQAISVLGEVVDAAPHNHPDRAAYLNNLGISLLARFKQTASMDDLNQAISVLGEVVDATPHSHPDRASCLLKLGIQVLTRFKQKGLREDLNQAVSLASEAVDVLPHNHPDRAGYLHNLGIYLCTRFNWMGLIDDLDRAVEVSREAVNITPHDHPFRPHLLTIFGALLSERNQRLGSMDDLNEAVNILHEALDAIPHGPLPRQINLNNLASFLSMRYKQTGSIDDLHQSINVLIKAVDSTPYNDPNRSLNLSNLGRQIFERFRQTRSEDDYDQAIRVFSEAVDITSLDDPYFASHLINLAVCLSTPLRQTRSKNELDRLIPMLTAGWHSEITPPRQRIQVAHAIARILMTQEDWEQSYQLLREAISLLHTLGPRFSNRADVQALLTIAVGLPSSAVSSALNAKKAPEDALRLLEQSRGVIASLLMDMRGDITDLQRQCPDVAKKFSLLRDELDLPSRSAVSITSTDKFLPRELQIKRRYEANREFSQVIETIRAQPGFSNFLRPPDVKELMSAAEQGHIIVLNINIYRCDAFLIQPDSIQVMKLPSLSEDEVRHRVTNLLTNSDLSPLLEWLWYTICHPCLNALGIKDAPSDDDWPHIWWIPTGPLSQLPLHAAGIYTQGSKETVLDRAVSSYASSIRALLHGRKNGIQKPRQPPSEDFALVVSMQETTGLGERGRLPFAADEVHILRDLCPQLQLASVTPSQNKEDVLKHLSKCKIFHFAGHGQSDPKDPSRSCLLLDDWKTNPLTVGDIRESRLQDDPPFLAYLSACSTGANKVEKLADEGIHLTSAFQLAGFRHAIGTLWEVSDKHCVDVARILYQTLQEEGMTDLAVSRGLHRAVRALREGNADDVLTRDAKLARPKPARQSVTDFYWVPYVHFGV